MTDLDKSISLAITSIKGLEKLHDQIGDYKRQSGQVIKFYERARRTLASDPLNIQHVKQVFYDLRNDVGVFTASMLLAGEQLGFAQAEASFDLYGFDYSEPESDTELIANSMDAVDSLIRKQLAAYLALLLSGEVSISVFFGEGAIWGIMSPRSIITTIKTFVANILDSVLSRVVEGQPGMGFQAVAILDEKTSPCCRAVDGQVQPVGKPFHLTEQPHYAEYMIKPPFHDGCRTIRTLVRLSDVQQF